MVLFRQDTLFDKYLISSAHFNLSAAAKTHIGTVIIISGLRQGEPYANRMRVGHVLKLRIDASMEHFSE